jgi:ribosomal protein L7Ae-like RNA K-turn-binding protein
MSNISKINLYCQKLKLNSPYFEILKKEGEDHHPTFQVACIFEKNNEIGEGSTLKAAKEDAAGKIVEMVGIDLKLKELENNVTYAIDSYNAPLIDIWENCSNQEYTLTLRKKIKDKCEYKNFKVKIIHSIDYNPT